MFFRQAKFVILIGLSIALGACGQSYREGMSASAIGSVFNYYLTEKYKDLAAAEAAEMDWKDADWFGIRALATALNEGAKDSKPDAAATAQAGFDCWMQEAEENHQPDDIQACKNAFWEGMKKLQERPEETTRGPWIIYFDFDKSDVTSDAQIVIDEAAAAVVKSSVKVLLTGHTDTSGSEKYNMALSERRTKSVAEKLKQAGVSDQQITPSSFGESKPAVATADGVKEAKNRRVEIRLEDQK
ncbi:MAG: OmpA family protein [Rhodospirillales bacterium]